MNIGIYVNLNRDIDGVVSKRFIEHITMRGCNYRIIERDEIIYPKEMFYSRAEVMSFADLIVVFGGDGTMLNITTDASKYGVPIFGINVGHLGFLSEVSPLNMCPAIDHILEGNYHEDIRDFIKVTYNGNHYYAINEVILSRDSRSKILKIDVYIDDILADTVKADGVMVATPTGSTAYSLSCGGPILSPNVKAFVVNSICPHSLLSRPIVVSNNSKVRFECELTEENIALLIMDGKVIETLESEHSMVIEKSDYSVKFLRLKETNFYNRLLSKMNTGLNK